jgi:hypothetical protein
LTGKGSEQAICAAGGEKIPWDDREVLRDLINSKKASIKNQIAKKKAASKKIDLFCLDKSIYIS